jgi:hypothetical protein
MNSRADCVDCGACDTDDSRAHARQSLQCLNRNFQLKTVSGGTKKWRCEGGVSDVRNLGKYCAATNGDHGQITAVVCFCSRMRIFFVFLSSIAKSNNRALEVA